MNLDRPGSYRSKPGRPQKDLLTYLTAPVPNGFTLAPVNKIKLIVLMILQPGNFPLISCTMALGLGQNCKRVQMVAHFVWGDLAAIGQMIGRCGRDGKPGLAVMLVEKTR